MVKAHSIQCCFVWKFQSMSRLRRINKQRKISSSIYHIGYLQCLMDIGQSDGFLSLCELILWLWLSMYWQQNRQKQRSIHIAFGFVCVSHVFLPPCVHLHTYERGCMYVNFHRLRALCAFVYTFTRICPNSLSGWRCICGGILFYGQCMADWVCVCVCVNVFVLHYSICVTLFCAFFGSNSVYRIYSIYYGRQREEKKK